ncbi:MAG: DUF3784 domain-containing protein [Lutisporaceae bacterium]
MEITIFIGPLILIILGIVIRFGKASWLISGYNTSSKYEKEKYDNIALCKFIGNLLFTLAIIFICISVATLLNYIYLTAIVMVGTLLVFIIIIAALIYINTGNRFKKQ